jgi:hypothetical protein
VRLGFVVLERVGSTGRKAAERGQRAVALHGKGVAVIRRPVQIATQLCPFLRSFNALVVDRDSFRDTVAHFTTCWRDSPAKVHSQASAILEAPVGSSSKGSAISGALMKPSSAAPHARVHQGANQGVLRFVSRPVLQHKMRWLPVRCWLHGVGVRLLHGRSCCLNGRLVAPLARDSAG